jgi:hypothetical protein
MARDTTKTRTAGTFRRAALALVAAPLLALAALAAPARPALAGDTECAGLLSAVVEGNVVVPDGVFRTLLDAQISGNVLVRPGAILRQVNTAVGGNLQAENAQGISIATSSIAGSVQVKAGPGPTIVGESTVGGSVEIIGRTAGGQAVTTGAVGGSIKVEANTGESFDIIDNGVRGDVRLVRNTASRISPATRSRQPAVPAQRAAPGLLLERRRRQRRGAVRRPLAARGRAAPAGREQVALLRPGHPPEALYFRLPPPYPGSQAVRRGAGRDLGSARPRPPDRSPVTKAPLPRRAQHQRATEPPRRRQEPPACQPGATRGHRQLSAAHGPTRRAAHQPADRPSQPNRRPPRRALPRPCSVPSGMDVATGPRSALPWVVIAERADTPVHS